MREIREGWKNMHRRWLTYWLICKERMKTQGFTLPFTVAQPAQSVALTVAKKSAAVRHNQFRTHLSRVSKTARDQTAVRQITLANWLA